MSMLRWLAFGLVFLASMCAHVEGGGAYLLSEEAQDRFGSPGDTSGSYRFKVAVGTNEANESKRQSALDDLMDAIRGWATNPVQIVPQGYYNATIWSKGSVPEATVSQGIAAEAAARQRLNEANGNSERQVREQQLEQQRDYLESQGVTVPW